MENLHRKFFWRGQSFQRRSRCPVERVIHLREKCSHLSSRGGNIISWTGLFLNCAHDKYMVLEMDVWRYRCLLRISCQTRTGSRLPVSPSVQTLPLCV